MTTRSYVAHVTQMGTHVPHMHSQTEDRPEFGAPEVDG